MVTNLKLDYATREAANYACKNWHYSKCVPVGKMVIIGVWENEKFIGVVIFSRGANKGLMGQFKMQQTDGCELTRVALTSHKTTVTRILSIAIKLLKKICTLKLLVSFADTEQGHVGSIYQGGGWIYTGKTNAADEYFYKGKRWHGRAFRKSNGSHLKYTDKGLKIIKGSQKHRYIMPLDNITKEKIESLRKPYPKRVEHEVNAFDNQSKEGGSIPTDTLQN